MSDKISFEIGLGFPSIGVGMKVFPSGIREGKLMFLSGITGTYVMFPDVWSGDVVDGVLAYLPLGMSYFGEAGFNFGIDVGPGVVVSDENNILPYGNLKLGYRF